MSGSENEEKILDLIEEVCDSSGIRDQRDTDLFKAGLLDSMGAIDLLVGIEDEFGVVIEPTQYDRDQMNTVDKIVARVEENL